MCDYMCDYMCTSLYPHDISRRTRVFPPVPPGVDGIPRDAWQHGRITVELPGVGGKYVGKMATYHLVI